MSRIRLLVFYLFVALLSLTASNADPQSPPLGDGECGSNVTPEEGRRYLEMLAQGLPLAPPQAIAPPYCVPIAGHIVRRSDHEGGLSLTQYQQAITDANNAFANTGIVFYSLGVDYIDDDDYYTSVDDIELTTLRQQNVVPAALNDRRRPSVRRWILSAGVADILDKKPIEPRLRDDRRALLP